MVIAFLSGDDLEPFIGTAKAVVAPVRLFCFSFSFWNVFRD
jgi:hypothetical protein